MLDACFRSAVLQKFAAFSRSLRDHCISSHSWPVGCFLGAAPPVPPSYARTPVTFPGSSRMLGFSKNQEKLSICRADRLRLGIYALRDQHSTQNFESWRLRVGSWVLTCTLLSKLPPTADAVGMWQLSLLQGMFIWQEKRCQSPYYSIILSGSAAFLLIS